MILWIFIIDNLGITYLLIKIVKEENESKKYGQDCLKNEFYDALKAKLEMKKK